MQQHYRRIVDLDATPAAVYAALTTAAGLRAWWTDDCRVGTDVGQELHFQFGASHSDFVIERLEPAREIAWRCVRAHIAVGDFTQRDEWVGTRLEFHLLPLDGGRTRLTFEHVGLVPALECYALCCDGWHYSLASMEQFVATGRGTPMRTVEAA